MATSLSSRLPAARARHTLSLWFPAAQFPAPAAPIPPELRNQGDPDLPVKGSPLPLVSLIGFGLLDQRHPACHARPQNHRHPFVEPPKLQNGLSVPASPPRRGTIYNGAVQKPYDVIVIGGGIIGLSLAWRLSRSSAHVLLIDRREPGQEASHAGGGMIADLDPVLPSELSELAHRSAQLYPSFVSELASEAERAIDLREDGVIAFEQHPIAESEGIRAITSAEALALEPQPVHSARPCLHHA